MNTLENRKVDLLLVEDNMFDAELTIRALHKSKTDSFIVHAKNGEEAWDFLTGTGKSEGRDTRDMPYVILLDIRMPGMSGIELLEKISSKEVIRQIPVVILTSSKDDPHMKRCYELGAKDYIVKPVDIDNFKKAVTQLGMYWLVENVRINLK